MKRREFVGGLSLLPFLGLTRKNNMRVFHHLNENLNNKCIDIIMYDPDYDSYMHMTPYKTTYNELLDSIKKFHYTRPRIHPIQCYHLFFDKENSLGIWCLIKDEYPEIRLVIKNYIFYPKSLAVRGVL